METRENIPVAKNNKGITYKKTTLMDYLTFLIPSVATFI